ncbi:UbiX family flavin prenyltransferase [Kamptonema cortianum]|nr:UbiX family flavin prenyltransferase [Oscillatoria laete-virens]MDK3159932.1 UbiX family flavin prenyltransferase [Kamptonema cortianum]MDL5047154.1 UbiX family flavin prenyltransferase [Oscillatoria amoena NRMC-F 0135]MDL5055513.1 UbiX family flavin prenyltransferase [Oscillatoria laete-virens NRMC-F 0139]
MRFVIGITGASGAIYAQRLLDCLNPQEHEIHVVMSKYAHQVVTEEMGELRLQEGTHLHRDATMNVPFVSGSARFDAMVIVPCSMGTVGRIVHGVSDTTLLRAADVFLKEKRKLLLVPRETPFNLIHARNLVSVMEAGATVIPAMPYWYHRPASVEELADTVVARILDHMGVSHHITRRWKDESE